MFLYFLAFFFALAAGGLGFTTYRFAKLALQYDEIFQAISPVLQMYGSELKRLASGDILIDNPEIATFHRLNLGMIKTIESVTDSVTSVMPKRKKKPGLPRPDVE